MCSAWRAAVDETALTVRSRSGMGLKEVVGEECGECGRDETDAARAAVGEIWRVGRVCVELARLG